MAKKHRISKLVYRMMGWKATGAAPDEDKCIMLGVPHTSVVDFVIAWCGMAILGRTPNIMIKKEFFFWPLGWLLRKMGAVPVDRSRGANVALHNIEALQKADRMILAIAPEGTRKKTEKWKKGFLVIAKACNLPIYLGGWDYKTKVLNTGVRFWPSDDPNEDLKLIQAHYAALGYHGRHKDCWSYGNVTPKLLPNDFNKPVKVD